MVLLHRETHAAQSQPWREENWMGEDWLIVPEEFEEAVLTNAPYLEYTLSEEGELIGVTPTKRPAPEKSELEVLRETVDMLVLEALGGGMDV